MHRQGLTRVCHERATVLLFAMLHGLFLTFTCHQTSFSTSYLSFPTWRDRAITMKLINHDCKGRSTNKLHMTPYTFHVVRYMLYHTFFACYAATYAATRRQKQTHTYNDKQKCKNTHTTTTTLNTHTHTDLLEHTHTHIFEHTRVSTPRLAVAMLCFEVNCRKKERRTCRPKQVPFHNRTHRTILLFARVWNPSLR